MWTQARRFCGDERGTLLITEWIFLATILVIAAIPFILRDNTDLQVRPASSLEPGNAVQVTGR